MKSQCLRGDFSEMLSVLNGESREKRENLSQHASRGKCNKEEQINEKGYGEKKERNMKSIEGDRNKQLFHQINGW